MAILSFRLEVLDIGYLVVDTTGDRNEFDEIQPDEPVAAFGLNDLEGAISYIRTEIMNHEAEVARLKGEMDARKAPVIGGAERFRSEQPRPTEGGES